MALYKILFVAESDYASCSVYNFIYCTGLSVIFKK